MVDTEFEYVGYFDRESCDLDEFKVLTSQSLTAEAVPFAAAVKKNVPVYDMAALRPGSERCGRAQEIAGRMGLGAQPLCRGCGAERRLSGHCDH